MSAKSQMIISSMVHFAVIPAQLGGVMLHTWFCLPTVRTISMFDLSDQRPAAISENNKVELAGCDAAFDAFFEWA